MLGLSYAPDARAAWRARRTRRAAPSRSMPKAATITTDQVEAQGARRRRVQDARARRGEGLRRHRAGDGEAARGRGRSRLAGQAHQSRLPRVRLVAVPRRDLHHRRDRARRAGDRSLRRLQPLPRGLPDAAPSPRPIGSMRAPASPTSPSSTKVISRRSSAPRWATASSAATIVLPSARGTNSRRPRARRSSPCAPKATTRRSPSCSTLDDARIPRAVSRHADQAHRPRPLPAQCADRRRQLRRRGARAQGGSAPRRPLAARPRHGGVGAVAARAGLLQGLARPRAGRGSRSERRRTNGRGRAA